MARPASPPGADHAAEQALGHIPTTLPPSPPQGVTTTEVDPGFGTTGLVGNWPFRLLNGADDDEEDET